MPSRGLDHTELPEPALPFVREFLLEVSRHAPRALAAPPRLAVENLDDPAGCRAAAENVLRWLQGFSSSLGQRMGEVGTSFASLRADTQGLGGDLRRTTARVRRWLEGEAAFARSVLDVLSDRGAHPAEEQSQILAQLADRLEAKEPADRGERRALLANLHALLSRSDQLQSELERAEAACLELQRQTMRDGVTGLWNLHATGDYLGRELERCRRYASPLTLLLWSLEDFAEINRSRGHVVGDTLLQAAAGRAVGALRRSDYLFRVGGGTFGALLPATDRGRAQVALARIVTALSGQPIATGAGLLQVRVRTAACAAQEGDDPASLLERARDDLAAAGAAPATLPEAPPPSNAHRAVPGDAPPA